MLAFPRTLLVDADQVLRERFADWMPDTRWLREHDGYQYSGFCRASDQIRAEFQLVPMLTALFWEVEHSVMYKPSPRLKGVAGSLEMQQRRKDVLKSLKAFEEEFANLIRTNSVE